MGNSQQTSQQTSQQSSQQTSQQTSQQSPAKGVPPPTDESSPQVGVDVWRAYVDQQVASLRSEILLLLSQTKSEAPPELAANNAKEEGKSVGHDQPATATHLDEHDEHALGENVWDCVVFVGFDCLGVGESCFVLLLVVLNIFVQLYFCYIIMTSNMLLDPLSPDKLDGLLRFRTGVAHRVENADLVSRRSLLRQVCNGEERLHVSGTQLSLSEDLESFKGQGGLLCLLALLCWSATALGEAGSTVRFAQAVFARRGSRTRVLAKANGGFVLESLSSSGVAKVFVVGVIPRLITAAVLFGVGLLYLSRTSRLEDLLLNAMALGFVLEVDDLLFAAFAPHRVKSLVRGLKPLPVAPSSLRALGLWPAVSRFLAAVGVMCVVFQVYLVPFHGRLQQALDILCSGEKDFVYSINPATGMVVSARSAAGGVEESWLPAECSVLHLAGLRLAEEYGWSPPGQEQCSTGPGTALTEFSSAEFDRVSGLAKADVRGAGVGALCTDEVRGNQTPAFLVALRHVVGFEANSCAEVKELCGLQNMTRVRALCAVTCQCTFMGYSLAGIFRTAEQGCPQQCLAEAKPIEATYTVFGFFPFGCRDQFGFRQHDDVQLLEFVDTNQDGIIWQEELDNAWMQGFVGADFRADLFLFDYWGYHAWNISDLAGFISVRDLWLRRDLDRDGTLTDAEVAGEGLDISGYDLDGDGALSKAEAAGHAVAPPLPQTVFWGLAFDWHRGTELYIRGLFEYLHSRPNFLAIVGLTLRLIFSASISQEKHKQVIAHFDNGAEDDWINERWTLAPGLSHPRNLTGCAFLASFELQLLLSLNLCSPTGLASLRVVCPESCKCQATMDDCPASCPSFSDTADLAAVGR